MDANPLELPFLSNIGFMLTYKCTVACPHCVVEAGPHRKEEMSLEHARTWIKQASNYRGRPIKALALTGGEPFYNLENLAQISSFGKALGFFVSVITNAFWAATKDEALNTLAKLPDIDMIAISTDVYHQKFIPFDFIKNAIWAAQELGRLYNLAVCTDNEADSRFQEIMADLNTIVEDPERIRVSIAMPVGRAQKRARNFKYHIDSKPMVAACSMAGSPVVFPDGKVFACIGPIITLPSMHPMYLGNLQEKPLSDILDQSELNPVLHTIRVWGPHKLISFLKQKGLDSLVPNEFISNCICDICYKLLSNERIVSALTDILNEEEINKTIAYGRLYYLKEPIMAELYHQEDS